MGHRKHCPYSLKGLKGPYVDSKVKHYAQYSETSPYRTQIYKIIAYSTQHLKDHMCFLILFRRGSDVGWVHTSNAMGTEHVHSVDRQQGFPATSPRSGLFFCGGIHP